LVAKAGGALLGGLCFVWVGAIVAPKHPRAVALTLLLLMTALVGIGVLDAVRSRDWVVLLSQVSISLGGAVGYWMSMDLEKRAAASAPPLQRL
jgi:hypothetical protein